MMLIPVVVVVAAVAISVAASYAMLHKSTNILLK